MTKQDKQTMNEEIKKQFWDKVLDVEPNDIKSETIKVVDDKQVDWLFKQAYLQGAKDAVEAVKRDIDSQTVYYRSKFSQDCSRGETEQEKSTEMIDREQTLELLSKQAQQFIDSLEKGTNNE